MLYKQKMLLVLKSIQTTSSRVCYNERCYI